jgi:hypothetical protein
MRNLKQQFPIIVTVLTFINDSKLIETISKQYATILTPIKKL